MRAPLAVTTTASAATLPAPVAVTVVMKRRITLPLMTTVHLLPPLSAVTMTAATANATALLFVAAALLLRPTARLPLMLLCAPSTGSQVLTMMLGLAPAKTPAAVPVAACAAVAMQAAKILLLSLLSKRTHRTPPRQAHGTPLTIDTTICLLPLLFA